MSKYKFYLGIGPMSQDIVDAVKEYIPSENVQLMFICSENQINKDGGYTGFTTNSFSKYIGSSKVWKCRDHCGPGFYYKTKQECFDTIRDDIENKFDLIHIDACWLDNNEKLKYILDAIELALSIKEDIKIEIGTETNTVKNKLTPNILNIYLQEILKLINPFFYILETSSVVLGHSNSHEFNICNESLNILQKLNIKIKEHNADYLTKIEIQKRYNIINGMNIAPQLGVIQTSTVLNEALIYGIDTSEFKHFVFNKNKWKKWSQNNKTIDIESATLLGGHYHFQSDEYKKLVDKLYKHVYLKNKIKDNIKKLITYYTYSYYSQNEN